MSQKIPKEYRHTLADKRKLLCYKCKNFSNKSCKCFINLWSLYDHFNVRCKGFVYSEEAEIRNFKEKKVCKKYFVRNFEK